MWDLGSFVENQTHVPCTKGRFLTTGLPGKSQLVYFLVRQFINPAFVLEMFILFIYLFLAVLGLRCFLGLALVAVSRGYSLVTTCRLLTAVSSLVVKQGL